MDNTKPKYRKELLDTAIACGAVLTGKPDGSESITVLFSIDAWRAFDVATSKSLINIQTCDHANQGAAAFREGKGISDNPWVASYGPPYKEANHWMSGYVTEQLRHAKIFDVFRNQGDKMTETITVSRAELERLRAAVAGPSELTHEQVRIMVSAGLALMLDVPAAL